MNSEVTLKLKFNNSPTHLPTMLQTLKRTFKDVEVEVIAIDGAVFKV